jgi:hypothetical protein
MGAVGPRGDVGPKADKGDKGDKGDLGISSNFYIVRGDGPQITCTNPNDQIVSIVCHRGAGTLGDAKNIGQCPEAGPAVAICLK